jgi:hypothetical protein
MTPQRQSRPEQTRGRLSRQVALDLVSLAQCGTEPAVIATCRVGLARFAAACGVTAADAINHMYSAIDSGSLGLSMAEQHLAGIGLCLLQSDPESTSHAVHRPHAAP